MDDDAWHDYCLVPTSPVHEFCLVSHKGRGPIRYTKFKTFKPTPAPPLEPLRPHPSDLYFKLRKKLGVFAALCPFEEMVVTDDTIIVSLDIIDKDVVEKALRIFEPKPRQITSTDTNKVILYF